MRFDKRGTGDDRWDVTQLNLSEGRVGLLLAQSQANKEIAARLGVSEAAISNRISALFRALHLQNRGQLVQWALQHPEAFVGGAIAGIEPLKIAQIEVVRLLSHTDAQIATTLHLIEPVVALRIADLLFLLHLTTRAELQAWGKLHPAALDLGWSETDLHRFGCDCGAPFCRLASLFSSLLL